MKTKVFKEGGLWDYHAHSTISFDGQISLFDFCREALNRGLSGVTFTEHWELGWGGSTILLDCAEYKRQIEEARNAFPSLDIGMGIELGYYYKSSAEAEAAAALGWDFVIGSAHNIQGVDVNGGKYCQGKTKDDCFKGYLRGLAEMINNAPCCDVVGHLDLPRRDMPKDANSLVYQDCPDEIDALFEVIIPRGIGIELNTAGLRYNLGAPQPDISILKRYLEKGGEVITCGTDCHTFKSIAAGINEGYEIIRQAGFKYISLFKERKLYQHKL